LCGMHIGYCSGICCLGRWCAVAAYLYPQSNCQLDALHSQKMRVQASNHVGSLHRLLDKAEPKNRSLGELGRMATAVLYWYKMSANCLGRATLEKKTGTVINVATLY
jgi:hypothetical protein